MEKVLFIRAFYQIDFSCHVPKVGDPALRLEIVFFSLQGLFWVDFGDVLALEGDDAGFFFFLVWETNVEVFWFFFEVEFKEVFPCFFGFAVCLQHVWDWRVVIRVDAIFDGPQKCPMFHLVPIGFSSFWFKGIDEIIKRLARVHSK